MSPYQRAKRKERELQNKKTRTESYITDLAASTLAVGILGTFFSFMLYLILGSSLYNYVLSPHNQVVLTHILTSWPFVTTFIIAVILIVEILFFRYAKKSVAKGNLAWSLGRSIAFKFSLLFTVTLLLGFNLWTLSIVSDVLASHILVVGISLVGLSVLVAYFGFNYYMQKRIHEGER
jgi:cation transport ATPase